MTTIRRSAATLALAASLAAGAAAAQDAAQAEAPTPAQAQPLDYSLPGDMGNGTSGIRIHRGPAVTPPPTPPRPERVVSRRPIVVVDRSPEYRFVTHRTRRHKPKLIIGHDGLKVVVGKRHPHRTKGDHGKRYLTTAAKPAQSGGKPSASGLKAFNVSR